ncbi:MAG: TlpA family protein disulfide reductase [Dehalococcoidia bacterium]
MNPRTLAVPLLACLVLTACGSQVTATGLSAGSQSATTPTSSEAVQGPRAAPALSPDNVVPAVPVIDVRTGENVDLGSVVPSDKPVLLWAWAPHCPTCRAEAPEVEAFAAANVDALTIVGMGTQDDLEYAKGFLADTGVSTPRMLWDPGFDSWRALGVTSQPTWILVRGDGSFIAGWVGGFPADEIQAALSA